MPARRTDPKLDAYFRNAKTWRAESQALREIVLDCGLTEELKWRQPCYTSEGKNIVIIQRMKDFVALAFFKGALLTDPKRVLERPGKNSQTGRRIPFTSVGAVVRMRPVLKAYVREAIGVEKAGLKVPKAAKPLLPEELKAKLDDDPRFRKAFQALTPGRQRGYALYFAGAKQPKTREARIAKYAPKILAGKGFFDR